MAAVVDCPNRDVNLQMCPCTSEDCERRGICCLCVQNHAGNGGLTACMRDAERPADTRALSGSGEACDQKAQNVEFCVCDSPCSNQGTCCDCVRNHWGNAIYPTPACMR